jgi:hypothetical protein
MTDGQQEHAVTIAIIKAMATTSKVWVRTPSPTYPMLRSNILLELELHAQPMQSSAAPSALLNEVELPGMSLPLDVLLREQSDAVREEARCGKAAKTKKCMNHSW